MSHSPGESVRRSNGGCHAERNLVYFHIVLNCNQSAIFVNGKRTAIQGFNMFVGFSSR